MEAEIRNAYLLPLSSWHLCKLKIALFMLNPMLSTAYMAFDDIIAIEIL